MCMKRQCALFYLANVNFDVTLYIHIIQKKRGEKAKKGYYCWTALNAVISLIYTKKLCLCNNSLYSLYCDKYIVLKISPYFYHYFLIPIYPMKFYKPKKK